MKNILEKIKGYYASNKQKVTLLGSLAIVMLLIILAIAIAVKVVTSKITYEELEMRLEVATEKYLQEHSDLFPNDINPTIVIEANTLVENKYIKNIQKLVKDSSCTANVIVDYANSEYKYQAYVTCNKFKTEKFIEVIKNNNEISQVGEGLYEMNNELVFRGQNPRNYVKFSGLIWRIVKINKEGNINMIITNEDSLSYGNWDNRYNTEKQGNYGINNFLLSRAFSGIKSYYDNNLKKNERFLAPFDLCVGKRINSSVEKNGSLECNELIQKQYIGLLPIYDFMNASLDGLCQTTTSKECQNYNYLTNYKFKWWTMTPYLRNTFETYYVNNGIVEADDSIVSAERRFVVALNGNVLYKSGNGTKSNPYIIR